ncbi:MAG: hypothetical protein HZB15_10965 [Actinobacteria bacterium]|nr:hypothetical protein [Actinomycetota bacterium]
MTDETGALADLRTLDDILGRASHRDALRPEDARSGAHFERLVIDGQRYFLKVLSSEADWIMRVTGNTTNWEHIVWTAGLYHRCPPQVDHAMVAMVLDRVDGTDRLAMLMHDRAADLVPPGDEQLPPAQHDRFIDHMACFHAEFLGWRDTLGLNDMEHRLLFFAPATIRDELRVADVPGPVRVADEGWRVLPERSPSLDALVRTVHAEPSQLSDAVRTTPATFVAGDWKMGNLGSRADGRTVLLDWAYPGEAPPCWELMWYLALNRARLPVTKEQCIADYRAALERHGVDTTGWFERQLGLCTVGIMATFAWEKAVGDETELRWWEAAATEGARWLS